MFYIHVILFFVLNADIAARCKAQDATMTRYIERRILTLEDRLNKCEQDIHQYVQEFKELSHKIVSRLDGLNNYKTELRNEIENVLARVERAEWDIDYLESTASSNTCLEVDEQLVEKQLQEHAEEKRKTQLKLNTSCNNMLANFKSHKTVKKAGDALGSWIQTTGNGSQEIYFFSGAKNNVLLKFANIEDFTDSDYMQKAENDTLPYFWQGTGHIVYNDFLFFHRNGTLNEIIKYNLQKSNVTHWMGLHGAGHIPAYQLSPFTKIDFAVDEQGLWAIHADASIGGNIVLTKIDHGNMVAEHVWDTSCDSKNAEAAFVMCGTLYVVYNSPSGGRSHIECIYDTSQIITAHAAPTLYFPKRYSSHSSLHYNPVDQNLYAWDEGYQILYKFDTRAKFENH
ncbi:hypothetical protein FKM82_003342 [Ascaphus truei]